MILHVDMDAFYASIEIRDNPALAGKPVAVGGSSSGRGVIAAASYEARKYGVHSAMPTVQALKKCPQLVLRPVNMERYVTVSRQLHAIFNRFTPEVEPLALDEAFLDVTASQSLFGEAAAIGQNIKDCIRQETDLIASVGVAANKFIAKIASDILKPDGFCVVPEGEEQAFLDPLPIERLWGVGKKTAMRFKLLGLRSICDVRQAGRELMCKEFGQQGDQIWRLANGQDKRPVDKARVSRSVSHETTFAHDVADISALRASLMLLVEQVGYRIRSAGLKAKTVTLKLRNPDFHTITRSKTLPRPFDSTDLIWETALSLLNTAMSAHFRQLRLLGVAVSNFNGELHDEGMQSGLFDDNDALFAGGSGQAGRKPLELDRLADKIRQRFGKQSIHRGRSTRN